MIHADLMLVVVEVLMVLDLEPPRPLLANLLLTGFTEHTAHGDTPQLTCVVLRPLTMCHNVSVTRSKSLLSSGRSVQTRPGLCCGHL